MQLPVDLHRDLGALGVDLLDIAGAAPVSGVPAAPEQTAAPRAEDADQQVSTQSVYMPKESEEAGPPSTGTAVKARSVRIDRWKGSTVRTPEITNSSNAARARDRATARVGPHTMSLPSIES